MSHPCREPDEVVTDEERRRRLVAERDGLRMMNSIGREPEELARMKARINEITRILMNPATPSGTDSTSPPGASQRNT